MLVFRQIEITIYNLRNKIYNKTTTTTTAHVNY